MQAQTLANILMRTPLAEVQLVDGSTNIDRDIKGIVTNGNDVFIYPLVEVAKDDKFLNRLKAGFTRFTNAFTPF
jgi:hypothetical protein